MAGDTAKLSAGKALIVGSTDPTYIPGKSVADDFIYDGLACINGPLVVGTGPNPLPPHVPPGAIESALVNILPRVPTEDNTLVEALLNGIVSSVSGDFIGLTEALEEVATDLTANVVGTAQNITALRISSDGFGLIPFPGIGVEISAPINNVIGGWNVTGFENVLGLKLFEGLSENLALENYAGLRFSADYHWGTVTDGVPGPVLSAYIS